mmetsp:Transcript_2718/g.5977  ORF Transcript_2718/g.5977 Transcript_2718/m.5977 type:complete len:220 (+) Transcript_2718:836-1495(+)
MISSMTISAASRSDKQLTSISKRCLPKERLLVIEATLALLFSRRSSAVSSFARSTMAGPPSVTKTAPCTYCLLLSANSSVNCTLATKASLSWLDGLLIAHMLPPPVLSAVRTAFPFCLSARSSLWKLYLYVHVSLEILKSSNATTSFQNDWLTTYFRTALEPFAPAIEFAPNGDAISPASCLAPPSASLVFFSRASSSNSNSKSDSRFAGTWFCPKTRP